MRVLYSSLLEPISCIEISDANAWCILIVVFDGWRRNSGRFNPRTAEGLSHPRTSGGGGADTRPPR